MSNEMDMGRQTQGIYEQKAEKGLAVGKGVRQGKPLKRTVKRRKETWPVTDESTVSYSDPFRWHRKDTWEGKLMSVIGQ